MTFAPENLKQVRRLLLDHLDIHENSRAYPTDLDPNEVGIVGDPAHRGGYHCGRDRVDSDDYSVRESSRDRNGLTEAASALDIGDWSTTVRGKRHDLRSMSMWLVAQCRAGTADTRDIREVIYSPDGSTVRRWDRLGRRSSGDSSHRWHTHISYHRDAVKAGRDLTPLFTRYLTSIGILKGDDEMDAGQAYVQHVMNYRVEALRANREQISIPASGGNPAISEKNELALALKQFGQRLANLESRPPVQAAPVDVAALAELLQPHLRAAVADVLKGGVDAVAESQARE